MSTATPQRYFRFPEEPDEERRTTEVRHNTSIIVLNARDTGDAAATAIISAWARHSTATNGFGD